MKKLILILVMGGVMSFYSENSFAALFCAGNRAFAPGGQGTNGQNSGQPYNQYGIGSQSHNSGSGGSGSSGSSGGGGGGSGDSPIQLAKVDTESENPAGDDDDDDDDNGNNSGGTPVTIGGIFPDGFDFFPPNNNNNGNPNNNPGGPPTIGGIFPESYNPILDYDGDDDDAGSDYNPSVPAAHAPEPASIALLASGLAGIGLRIRRRKK